MSRSAVSAQELRTEDFAYPLPEALIASRPPARRDGSRLLVIDRETGRVFDRRFPDLRTYLRHGDALVLNDTRVFPARLRGRKPSGAAAEIFLLRPLDDGDGRRWEALVRPGGKLKPGRTVVVNADLKVAIEDSTIPGNRVVRLLCEGDPREIIERFGDVPLPPYIRREPEAEDRVRYQTVYADHSGSVAAPTAGLHFTRRLLARIEAAGVRVVRLTLHVGLGTFRPVDAARPAEHAMHAEHYRVSANAAATLNRVRAVGGRIWAVGTTSVRTLETVATEDGEIRPGEGWTKRFIYPPYTFRAVDGLLTNFHLPRSSLLMLVSAFAGRERVLAAYEHAVRSGYRFYSYGDAMLLT